MAATGVGTQTDERAWACGPGAGADERAEGGPTFPRGEGPAVAPGKRAGACESGARGRGLRARRAWRRAAPWLLALPALALVGVFAYGVANGLAQGLGVMPSLGMTTPTLDYYVQALTRSDLAGSLAYSGHLALTSALIALVGGVALAAALTRARAGASARLLGLQVPLMTMHALVALAVTFLFSGSGLAARVLHAAGLVATPGDFPSVVGDPSGWGVIAVYVWKEIPYVAFCTVTVMMHVSDSLGEAAATCGAGRWRTFFCVTLPLCRGAALQAFLVVLAFAFGSYEVPALLGPTLPKTAPVLAYLEFQDPDLANRCYAMALNGIVTVLCSLVAAAYFALLARADRKWAARG